MMMKKNKILVLGSLAFDYIFTFEESFLNAVSVDHEKEQYQGTITAKSRVQHFGGTAGNIAYNLGLLNLSHVTVVGSVGKDFEHLGYKDHIQKFPNINLNVDIHGNLHTAACYIVNDIKANQMIIFHGGALDKCKDINLKEKISDPENYLYAINSTQSVEAMVNFGEQLHEIGIPTIFDPGQVVPLFPKELLLQMVKKSEILIGNIHELKQIKSKLTMNETDLMKELNAIIMTMGADGSKLIYKNDKQRVHEIIIPIAKPEKILDSTGAGDGYRAGILTGLLLNMTLLDACKLGSVMGSFVIETTGAQTQSFTLIDVKKRFYETYHHVPAELKKIMVR
ncbi:MAG: carbohydrate kinase family protein [Promethearchaeota archaeon]